MLTYSAEMTTSTIIYGFGALPPTEGANHLHDLFHRAWAYQKRLSEIERESRARYRDIEREVVSVATVARLTRAETAVAETDAAVAKKLASKGKDKKTDDVKVERAALRAAKQERTDARAAYKVESDPLRQASALVKAAHQIEEIARKAAHKRDRDDVAIAGLLTAAPEAGPLREAAAEAREAADRKARESAAKKRARRAKSASAADAQTDDDQAAAKAVAAIEAVLSGVQGSEAELSRRLHASEARAAAEGRKARSESGLPWGVYNLVEEAVQKASQKSQGDPDKPRYPPFTGEGRIGSPQLVGGVSVEDLSGDNRFRLRVLPPKAGRVGPDGQPSHRGERRRFAEASIRIGMNGNEPVWITWPVMLHRPLPEHGRIVQAWALCERVGSIWKWQIQITVTEEDRAPKPLAVKGRAVAVDLGWRATAGWRVGYLVDTDGHHEEIRVPEVSFAEGRRRRKQRGTLATSPVELLRGGWRQPLHQAIDYLDGVRSVRDRHRDVAIGFLRAYLSEVPDRPPWLVEATRHIHAWKAQRKIVSLLRTWERSEARIPGDETILDGIRAWMERDRHLWDWDANGRDRVLRHRREVYRVLAARLARDYETILLPDIDLRDFAESPEREEGLPSEGKTLRKQQRASAPSELRETIAHAGKQSGRHVRKLDPKNDSRTCHVCGLIEAWDDPAALYHLCGGCGSLWDRDPNACINRLRRGGFDPARALRLCLPQPLAGGTSDGRPDAALEKRDAKRPKPGHRSQSDQEV